MRSFLEAKVVAKEHGTHEKSTTLNNNDVFDVKFQDPYDVSVAAGLY